MRGGEPFCRRDASHSRHWKLWLQFYSFNVRVSLEEGFLALRNALRYLNFLSMLTVAARFAQLQISSVQTTDQQFISGHTSVCLDITFSCHGFRC